MGSSAVKALKQSVAWFHALSDETRLQILDCLSEGEQCVCDLTDRLQAAQSRLSFHLKTLKEAGLITDRREGRWIYYALNEDTLAEIKQWVTGLKGRSLKMRPGAPCCE